jgi:hypothetical protein
MFGHVAGRQHPSRWVILSFLFTAALAWSVAVVGERVGDTWGFLRLGLTIALIVSVGRLGVVYMKSRRQRRKEAERSAQWDETNQSDAQPAEQRRTYGEIFYGSPPEPDGHDDRDDHDESGEAELETAGHDELVETDVDEQAVDVDEDDEIGVEVMQGDAVEVDLDAALGEDELVEGDHDAQTDTLDEGDTFDVADIEADIESQDAMQRMREEFKARAKEAQLRLKQRDAEHDEAPAAPNSP